MSDFMCDSIAHFVRVETKEKSKKNERRFLHVNVNAYICERIPISPCAVRIINMDESPNIAT